MNYREEIKRTVESIPKSVQIGGVMSATLWKQKAIKALELAKSSKTNETQLQRALEELKRF
jgi:hypothetical protein